MIRDFDLIRKILLEVESAPSGVSPIPVECGGEYPKPVINEHLSLLIDAGLLEGKPLRSTTGIATVAIQGLTWEGHDFIQAAGKEVIWKKAFEIVKEKGGAITFEVLKGLVKSLALKAAGLP